MANEIVYMLGVVAVGFAVNYALRALPFLLFAGRGRALPDWVTRFGNILSPVIIAGLIVYSYSGLAFRTPWPYVAGALTIALQVFFRNPLASIVAGTVVYMCLLSCGCKTAPHVVEFDARNPAIRVTETEVFFGEEKVNPKDIADLLDEFDVPKNRTIHIRLDPSAQRNMTLPRTVMGLIAKAGWTRPVLVTDRHAESFNTGKGAKADRRRPPAKPARRVIRYKGANEE